VLRSFIRVTLPLTGMSFINQAGRGVMAVVGPVLAVQYGLSASELGLLASVLFLAYGLWQLPLGVLLDMFGPRRVQTWMGLLAAAGFALFALSDGLVGFMIARAMIGVGVAAGLMAVLKANAQVFPRAQVAGMTGIAMFIGTAGSLLATAPVEALLPLIGWRGANWVLVGLTLAAVVWIHTSVEDQPGSPNAPRSRGWRGETAVILAIARSPVFWRLTPLIGLMSIFTFTYHGLWAGPWLRDLAGLDGQARATTLFCYAIGMMIGGLTMGQLTSRMQMRGHPPMLVPAAAAILMLLIQAGFVFAPKDFITVTVLWSALALIAAAGPPGYAVIAQFFPVEQMGRVSTVINTVVLGGAFLMQSLIGWILDLWPRTAAGGWEPEGYVWAMGLSMAMQVAALLWAWRFLRRRGTA
jgi:MFS family permease